MNQEHKNYLEFLQESGVTNMFGAGAYLQNEFGLSRHDAKKVLLEWMGSYRKENDGNV
jgi:hypothetical protein